MNHDSFDFDACLGRIRAGWQAGRTCRLAARGMAGRVLKARRDYQAGRLPLDRARAISLEAEAVSFAFGPIAGGGSHGRH